MNRMLKILTKNHLYNSDRNFFVNQIIGICKGKLKYTQECIIRCLWSVSR